ncbi:MAG TPA: hypothetical protein VG937_37350 [Polyangiaceae bacterium]|jgi:hypothetical protein|nr:hypothetical protein [Polyangiaceae bacterium]
MLQSSAWSLLALLVLGCASVSADARMDAELSGHGQAVEADATAKGEVPERDRPLSEQEAALARSTLVEGEPERVDFALFGARHDFTVKDPSGSISCRCVAALLGPPSSGKLEWRGEMPKTKPETQLVVALVPDSGECAGAPKGAGGASYWGYRVEGNDVIVLLEDWKSTRPRTLGAIIPKPPTGGQVYLASVSRKLPYGAPASGAGNRCALGNPGPQRTQPLSVEESGTAASDSAGEAESGE